MVEFLIELFVQVLGEAAISAIDFKQRTIGVSLSKGQLPEFNEPRLIITIQNRRNKDIDLQGLAIATALNKLNVDLLPYLHDQLTVLEAHSSIELHMDYDTFCQLLEENISPLNFNGKIMFIITSDKKTYKIKSNSQYKKLLKNYKKSH